MTVSLGHRTGGGLVSFYGNAWSSIENAEKSCQ
jgi:hypothetical protein